LKINSVVVSIHISDRFRRWLWTIILVLVLGVMCVHLGLLTSGFMAGETSIEVKIAEARVLEFPAVTICNANPIKKSALRAAAGSNPQLQELQELLELDGPGGAKKKRKRSKTFMYASQERTPRHTQQIVAHLNNDKYTASSELKAMMLTPMMVSGKCLVLVLMQTYI
jgi:hypothetical protein